MQARSEALTNNQEAVIAQQLAENWPEIVRAGAGALGNVDHIVVLNGADGMGELLAKALAMGGTGLGLARQLLGAMSETQQAVSATNGTAPRPSPTARVGEEPPAG